MRLGGEGGAIAVVGVFAVVGAVVRLRGKWLGNAGCSWGDGSCSCSDGESDCSDRLGAVISLMATTDAFFWG